MISTRRLNSELHYCCPPRSANSDRRTDIIASSFSIARSFAIRLQKNGDDKAKKIIDVNSGLLRLKRDIVSLTSTSGVQSPLSSNLDLIDGIENGCVVDADVDVTLIADRPIAGVASALRQPR